MAVGESGHKEKMVNDLLISLRPRMKRERAK